jgi:hypothetical protein
LWFGSRTSQLFVHSTAVRREGSSDEWQQILKKIEELVERDEFISSIIGAYLKEQSIVDYQSVEPIYPKPGEKAFDSFLDFLQSIPHQDPDKEFYDFLLVAKDSCIADLLRDSHDLGCVAERFDGWEEHKNRLNFMLFQRVHGLEGLKICMHHRQKICPFCKTHREICLVGGKKNKKKGRHNPR